MKPRILITPIASLLLTLPAFAVTDTWDGGGLDDILTTAENWQDDTAPASDLVNTDLIFAGATRLTPSLSAPFSADSITFDNTAGAFTIQGAPFNVGSGGITNEDAQMMAFTVPVSFSGVASAPISAIAGALTFADSVTLPTGALNVNGPNDTSFKDIFGSGMLVKSDAGVTTWTSSVATHFNVTINAGTLRMDPDGGADVFSGASIAVNGAGIFDLGESITLDGAQLNRSSGAIISLASGKMLTVENGSGVTITGSYSNGSASTINVTGAGSTFAVGTSLDFNGGSTLNVSAGGMVGAGSLLRIGSAGNGTVSVTGNGSSLSAGDLNLGQAGSTGTITFSNGATGTFADMSIDASNTVGTNGIVNIQSGATVTANNLLLAPNAFANAGTVTISGTDSALTLSGAATVTIGAASGSGGSLNVQTNGDFNSGTGLATVNATGTIAITSGGRNNSNGDLVLNGGQLVRDSIGVFALAAGKTLTVQGGGEATITGAYTAPSGVAIVVTGTDSRFSTTQTLTFGNGSTAAVLSGGHLSSGTATLVSGPGDGVVTVDGAGSSFTSGTLNVGRSGFNGTVTFRNGSSGSLNGILVDVSSSVGTVGTLNIQGGASVTGTSLKVASTAAVNSGTVTITGAGSALTLSDAATATIGAASASLGTVNVENGGTFTTGTGLTMVNATGDLNVNAGGTMIVRGNMTVLSALDIAGTVVLGGSAPPAPEDPSENDSGFDVGELSPPGSEFAWEAAHVQAHNPAGAIPEPGISALLMSALAFLGIRRRPM